MTASTTAAALLKQSLSQADEEYQQRLQAKKSQMNIKDDDDEEEEDPSGTDVSVSKLTVATAPLTPTIDIYSNPLNDESYDAKVPLSSSTLSSHNNNNNHDVDSSRNNEDFSIPHSCSSPYLSEAFLFSSEWLNGTASGELNLPDMMAKQGLDDNDGETDSVVSGGYFEPVDLDKSHWSKAINIDGPTFGFAMVALATALMHPVLFVAGALTAFGTVKAVGAGYEYCNNDSMSNSWDQCLLRICNKDLPSDTTKDPEQIKAEEKEDVVHKGVNDSGVLSDSFDLVVVSGGGTRNQVTPATALANLAQSSALVTAASEVEKKALPSDEQQKDQQPMQQSQESLISNPDTDKRPVTLELLQDTYPLYENTVVKDVSFPGLNAIEFFRVFFADEAPYNFKALQEKRGDLDIVYGHWEELDPSQRISLHHDETQPSIPLQQCRYKSFQGRVLTFKAKTNNFIGPVYACTRKTQRILLSHKTLVVMESRTDLSEIPFCDKFYVLERWIVSAEKVDGKYVSTLHATSQVVFTSSCQFASQIKTKSASTIQDLVKCWCTMAKEALKLTEQSKKMRLQQEEEEEEDSDMEDDEDAVVRAGNEENVPPLDDEEGVEVTWPEEKQSETPKVQIQDQKSKPAPRNRSSSLRRPRILKHSDSAPFPDNHRDRPRPLQGFRRSVSSLWTKR